MNLPAAQSDRAAQARIERGRRTARPQKAQSGDAGPAPEVGATELTAANGGPNALIALSANLSPPLKPSFARRISP